MSPRAAPIPQKAHPTGRYDIVKGIVEHPEIPATVNKLLQTNQVKLIDFSK